MRGRAVKRHFALIPFCIVKGGINTNHGFHINYACAGCRRFGDTDLDAETWLREFFLEMHPADRRDFLIGFLSIIVINVLLFGTLHSVNLRVAASPMSTPAWIEWGISLSPWVINGGLLILALLFRPKVATGFFSLIGFLVLWGVLSFAFLAASCCVLIGIVILFI